MRPRLRALGAPARLLRASALWPGCAALRAGALKVLHEVAELDELEGRRPAMLAAVEAGGFTSVG